jgi:hypothetical protein
MKNDNPHDILFPPFDDNGGDGADEYLFNYNRRLLYT